MKWENKLKGILRRSISCYLTSIIVKNKNNDNNYLEVSQF